MNQEQWTFLFDVNSHFHRMYEILTKDGIPNKPKDTHNGVPVFVLKPLLGLINKEIRIANEAGYFYSHIAMVFDDVGENFRHRLYPLYKAGRPEKSYECKVQLDLALKMLQSQGYPCIQHPDVEGDDTIATLSTKLSKHNRKTLVFTGDKDSMALINNKTHMYAGAAKRFYTPDRVVEKMGVKPELIPSLLPLIGDKPDNIDGIPKVGPKTAALFLNSFTLDEIINQPEVLKELKFSSKDNIINYIRENKDKIILMKELAKLRTDLELGITLNTLVKSQPKTTNFLDEIISPDEKC